MEPLPENSVEEFAQQGIDATEATLRTLEQNAIRMHRLFVQNQDGAALLKDWKEKMIMVPTVTPNSTQFEAGIEEGFKSFVRNIIIQVERFEQTVEKDNG